jgi:RimJ/RimL family protein N-acetyltransferase
MLSIHTETERECESLVLRRLERGDRDRLVALFAGLSADSRFKRFLTPKRELTPREVAHLTDIDHLNHEAIGAIDERDGSVVGVARYIVYAHGPKAAEVAVEIADDYQGMGIGTALVHRLVQRARANRVSVLAATTLRDNRMAINLAKRVGFHAVAGGGREIQWAYDLTLSRSAAA